MTERSIDDVLRAHEEALAGSSHDTDRDLLLLLEFSKAMNSVIELRPLLDLALQLLLEATGGERGTILMGGGDAPLEVMAVRSASGTPADLPASQGIARQVLSTGQPFHSDSVRSDPRARLMESVHAQGLEWVVAVPLRHMGKTFGVFYADSRQPAPRLGPGALPLVEALAEHAAIAVERARLQEQERDRERALREIDELHRLDRQKSLFIHQLVHELSNPLTSISGYARRLQGAAQDERQGKAARIVVEESERLLRLVAQLLDLAKSKAPPRQQPHTTFALPDLVRDACERLELPHAGAVVAEDVGANLHGARDDLLRVLLNVVGNALKHGATQVTLRAAASSSGMVELQVEDDGPGIPEDQRERVFDEFWRGAGAGSTAGHGLGLSIVRGLVESHGGRAAIGAGEAGGTLVTFTWPGAMDPAPSS